MARRQEHHLLFARVLRVLDGDTFVVECGPIGFRVRVADCNTPEKGKDGWADARDYTRKNLEGQWVGLGNRNQQWDRYARKLSEVYFGKDFTRNLAEELIAGGLAVSDPTTAANVMLGTTPPDWM
jgi:endonuclease YncB( thermonuclease family)